MSHYSQTRIACERPVYILAPTSVTDSLRTPRMDADSEFGEAYLNLTNADDKSVEIMLEQWCDCPGCFESVAHLRISHDAARLLSKSILHAIECSETE